MRLAVVASMVRLAWPGAPGCTIGAPCAKAVDDSKAARAKMEDFMGRGSPRNVEESLASLSPLPRDRFSEPQRVEIRGRVALGQLLVLGPVSAVDAPPALDRPALPDL